MVVLDSSDFLFWLKVQKINCFYSTASVKFRHPHITQKSAVHSLADRSLSKFNQLCPLSTHSWNFSLKDVLSLLVEVSWWIDNRLSSDVFPCLDCVHVNFLHYLNCLVIRSTLSFFVLPPVWFHHLEQPARQRDICPVSVNLLSASKNISVPGLVPWHYDWSPLNYSPPLLFRTTPLIAIVTLVSVTVGWLQHGAMHVNGDDGNASVTAVMQVKLAVGLIPPAWSGLL